MHKATYAYENFNPNWSKDDHPIVNVSWDDAMAYARWAMADLPTEAQWEKAARGTDGRKYPWGNDFDPSKLWCSKKDDFDAGGTHKVGELGVGPYGCTDMAGNVLQWTRDWFDFDYLKSDHGQDPRGPNTGSLHVLRGVQWAVPAASVTVNAFSAYREGNEGPPKYLNYGVVGFRCAVGTNFALPPSKAITTSRPAQPPAASQTKKVATSAIKKPATAEELAVDPAAAGFAKIGAMATTYNDGSDGPVDQQWTKDNPDGTVDVLTVRTLRGKIIGASLRKWSK